MVKGAVRGKKRVDAVDGTFACPQVRVPTPAPQDSGVGGAVGGDKVTRLDPNGISVLMKRPEPLALCSVRSQ